MATTMGEAMRGLPVVAEPTYEVSPGVRVGSRPVGAFVRRVYVDDVYVGCVREIGAGCTPDQPVGEPGHDTAYEGLRDAVVRAAAVMAASWRERNGLRPVRVFARPCDPETQEEDVLAEVLLAALPAFGLAEALAYAVERYLAFGCGWWFEVYEDGDTRILRLEPTR